MARLRRASRGCIEVREARRRQKQLLTRGAAGARERAVRLSQLPLGRSEPMLSRERGAQVRLRARDEAVARGKQLAPHRERGPDVRLGVVRLSAVQEDLSEDV